MFWTSFCINELAYYIPLSFNKLSVAKFPKIQALFRANNLIIKIKNLYYVESPTNKYRTFL